MSKKTEDKAYQEGRETYEEGSEESKNPYPAGSSEEIAWNDGYNDAADEAEA